MFASFENKNRKLNFDPCLHTEPRRLFATVAAARAPSVRVDPECVASVNAPHTPALRGAHSVFFARPLGLAAHLHSGGEVALLAAGTLMCPEQV